MAKQPNAAIRMEVCLLLVICLGAATNVVSFTVSSPGGNHRCILRLPPNHRSYKQPADGGQSDTWLFSTSQPQSSAEAEARAGTDGYSLLRQPVNWNADEDPEFDAPSALREEDEQGIRQEDSLWWNNNIKGVGMNNKSGNDSRERTIASSSSTASAEQDEELDLYQRSLDTLDFPRVLKALNQECATVPARQLVQEASHFHNLQTTLGTKQKKKIPKKHLASYAPLIAESVEEVNRRYRAVQEMEWLLSNGNGRDIRLDNCSFRNRKGYKVDIGGRGAPLQGMTFNLQAVMDIADDGKVLEGPEILEVSSIMDALEDVLLWSQALEKVDSLSFVELPTLAKGVTLNTTLQDLLHNAFDNKGRLSGTTFPVLGALRERVRTLKTDIMGTLDSLLAMPSIQSKLALESGGSLYSEVSGGRLVIPVASKYASSVGIVHDTSRSEKTVYVEPTEIVGPTNELRQTESELRQEEARVWRLLTEQVLKNRVDLEASVSSVGQLDLVTARLQLGKKLEGIIPLVKDEGVVSLRNAKHPVLLLREIANVVGSDIDLGADGNQGLVLTGPNSGGKTVILKLLGLIALMSRGGIPVPAAPTTSSADSQDNYIPRVDFFDPVLADIGDLQSVGGDLSTFSGHMLVCREILSNSQQNALVLMDELGSGTDPNQGVAIAQALMEALLETGARVVITTHYLQLKQLAASDDRFAVAGMQFVNGRPTYKLLPGTVGESFALAVAERLMLPSSVLDRANELLDSETRQMGDLIRELEDQRALVDQQNQELEAKKKEMAAMELKIKEEKMRLEKKQLTARRDEAKKFAKKLEEKEKVLEDILDKLKQDPSRRVLANSWNDIKFVKRDALSDAENVGSVLSKKKQAAKAMKDAQAELVPLAELRDKPALQPGDKLVICQSGTLFGREATVISSQRNRVTVQVSGVSMGLKLTDVALPPANGSSFSASPAPSQGRNRKSSISKAAERALQAEKRGPQSANEGLTNAAASSAKVIMRTDSNTVDVRGCNLLEAQEKAKAKFSSALMSGRPVVYILHGHGTGGVLKSKIRNWLKGERTMVKKFQAADKADGGDAFTRVELK